MTRVLIIGAGIVGLALAWRLRRDGAEVAIVDAAPPGEGGASFGNAGAISSSSVVPLAMPGLLKQVPRMLLDPAAPLHIPPGYWQRRGALACALRRCSPARGGGARGGRARHAATARYRAAS